MSYSHEQTQTNEVDVMASIEFDLARLTAQSHGMEPRLPGGIPELTSEDIALCVAMVSNPDASQLLMAKYCQDEQAISESMRYIFWFSWVLWAEKRRGGEITFKAMVRFAELTLLDYLVPKRLTESDREIRAAFMGIKPETWARKFRKHHAEIIAHLLSLETDAVRQIKKRLK